MNLIKHALFSELTGELFEERCADFSEDPRNNQGNTKQAAVGKSRGALSDARRHRCAQSTRQRRTARCQARHLNLVIGFSNNYAIKR